jgi:hypothetical protein
MPARPPPIEEVSMRKKLVAAAAGALGLIAFSPVPAGATALQAGAGALPRVESGVTPIIHRECHLRRTSRWHCRGVYPHPHLYWNPPHWWYPYPYWWGPSRVWHYRRDSRWW